MNFFKNRTVIGVICIILSLVICFAVTPLFNKSMSQKTEIVRVVKEIHWGMRSQRIWYGWWRWAATTFLKVW